MVSEASDAAIDMPEDWKTCRVIPSQRMFRCDGDAAGAQFSTKTNIRLDYPHNDGQEYVVITNSGNCNRDALKQLLERAGAYAEIHWN